MKTEVLLKSVLVSSLIFGIAGCGDNKDDKTIKKEQIEENKNDKAKDNQIINNEPNNNKQDNISDKKDNDKSNINNNLKKSEKDINNKNTTINKKININDDKNNSKDNQKNSTEDSNKPDDNEKNKPNKDDKKIDKPNKNPNNGKTDKPNTEHNQTNVIVPNIDDKNKTKVDTSTKDDNNTNINEPDRDNSISKKDNNKTDTIKDDNKTKIDSNTSNPNIGTILNSLILYTPNIQALKDNNITLSLKDDKGNTIKNNITWIATPKKSIIQYKTSNIITPLKDTDIKLQAKYNNILSNPITLQVKWIVNGHTLPPMPDEKINNSTLLGIDVNDNGVRDDVERAIYEKFKSSVRQGILMQTAKAHTKMLADPDGVKHAVKWQPYIASIPIGCNSYLFMKHDVPFDIDSKDYMKNKLYNNKNRLEKYMYYNQALGGGVYGGNKHDTIDSCDFNVTKALKEDGVIK